MIVRHARGLYGSYPSHL